MLPYHGAREGPSGFFKGFGRGTAGLALKPAAGKWFLLFSNTHYENEKPICIYRCVWTSRLRYAGSLEGSGETWEEEVREF